MDAFSEMGPSEQDTLVTTLVKVSTRQEEKDKRPNETFKKLEERNNTLTYRLATFQKNQAQQPQRSSFLQIRGQNSNPSESINRRSSRSRFRGSN